ncbi:CocE/NonD family hydrolase [Streptomyces sp. NPDC093109]|uniref:CocE/NonD family hydrolase n=1 Tax=Streptomyces sp. NPDC093109 TaxID=3154977 RepID=UPI00344D68C5
MSELPGTSTDAPATPFARWLRDTDESGPRRFETGIPVRDGVELAADVYLPEGDGPAPAIVTITPYGKDSVGFATDEARFYQRHGYVFVAVDVRGRGKSQGTWVPFAHDPDDGYDVVEWVAAQSWCTGNVGMTGLSYMGWTQWAAASRRPPHLTCMVSTSAAGRWQQEIPFTNGAFQLYFAWWAFATRRRISEIHAMAAMDWDRLLPTLPYDAIGTELGIPQDNWRLLTRQDRLDDFWQALRFDDRYDRIDIPCLHVTGWYDLEDLLGAFHHYEHMAAASPAADSQYLLVGPWSHLKSRYPDRYYAGRDLGPDAAWDMDAEHLRWFDHWLKNKGPGLDDVARIRLFEPGTDRWRTPDTWPMATSERSLFLGHQDEEGVLTVTAQEQESSTAYRYDPADPVPTQVDVRAYPVEDVPLLQDVNEARPDVLTFTGPSLETETRISGWGRVELFASSDCDDTEWHVKLCDVHPDGRSYKVTQGCLRAACRDSPAEPAPLTPDEITGFTVELWPTQHVFLPGHRVRVTVTSSDFPWFARSLNRFGVVATQADARVALNTVAHGGDHPSRLVLPVVDAAAR